MGERRMRTAAAFGLALLLGAALAARILAYPLKHDEQMFVPAGVLLGDAALYGELNYNHLPNLPLLLHAVYAVTGTEHYLLAGRFLVIGFWLLLAAGIWLAARRLGAGPGVAGFAVLLAVTNNILLERVGVLVTNNLVPIAAAAAGFWLLLAGLDGERPRPGRLFLAGLLLALAPGFKANYLFVVPPTALATALVPHTAPWGERLRRGLVPFALGGILGASPTLYHLATRPTAFLFDVLGYHTGPSVAWRRTLESGEDVVGLTLAEKLLFAWDWWLSGTTLLALVAAACLLATLLHRAGPRTGLRRLADWRFLVLLGCAGLGALVSFVPTPAFPHYYAPPIVFLILLVPCLWRLLAPAEREAASPLLVGLGALALVISGPRLASDLPALARPAQWAGLRAHAIGEQLAARLAAAGGLGPLATLAPIYPLEGGVPIYRELADGPFFFRVGEFLTPEERARHGVLAPSALDGFLAARPPAGVYVGFEGALDAPFADWARRRGWRPLAEPIGRDGYGEGALWLPAG